MRLEGCSITLGDAGRVYNCTGTVGEAARMDDCTVTAGDSVRKLDCTEILQERQLGWMTDLTGAPGHCQVVGQGLEELLDPCWPGGEGAPGPQCGGHHAHQPQVQQHQQGEEDQGDQGDEEGCLYSGEGFISL